MLQPYFGKRKVEKLLMISFLRKKNLAHLLPQRLAPSKRKGAKTKKQPAPMTTPKTVRILSLDGGGMRGYLSAAFLKRFIQQWGINPNELRKNFDIIAGTSIGGIQACGYANGLAPSDLQTFFVNNGPLIFTTSSTTPGVRATTLDKISTMVFGGSFYPNTNLISALNTAFGATTLQNLQTNVLITSCDYNTPNPSYGQTTIPILFSNAMMPGYIGQTELAQNVALATGSAPLYFPAAQFAPPSSLTGVNFVDGGVMQNNPAQLALTLGQSLYPAARRFCVLSVGTGLGDIGFPPSSSCLSAKHAKRQSNCDLFRVNALSAFNNLQNATPEKINLLQHMDRVGAFENMYALMDLIEMGIGGPQEVMAFNLGVQANLTGSSLFYYRFNVTLDPTQDTELDNSSLTFLSYLDTAMTAQYETDAFQIGQFISRLSDG